MNCTEGSQPFARGVANRERDANCYAFGCLEHQTRAMKPVSEATPPQAHQSDRRLLPVQRIQPFPISWFPNGCRLSREGESVPRFGCRAPTLPPWTADPSREHSAAEAGAS